MNVHEATMLPTTKTNTPTTFVIGVFEAKKEMGRPSRQRHKTRRRALREVVSVQNTDSHGWVRSTLRQLPRQGPISSGHRGSHHGLRRRQNLGELPWDARR